MSRSRRLFQGCIATGALLLSLAAHARTLHGVVTYVTDGDSLWVRLETGGVPRQVRLHGIDAPEICQVGGRAARDALSSVALRREVLVQTRATDRYQRIVARVYVGSQDLGAWLVARGHAWSEGYQSRTGPYARQQERAMAAGLGLWSSAAPMRPREFRRRHGSCR